MSPNCHRSFMRTLHSRSKLSGEHRQYHHRDAGRWLPFQALPTPPCRISGGFSMTLKQFWKTSCASIATLSMLLTPNAFALETSDPDDWQFVEIAPPSGPEVQPY